MQRQRRNDAAFFYSYLRYIAAENTNFCHLKKVAIQF